MKSLKNLTIAFLLIVSTITSFAQTENDFAKIEFISNTHGKFVFRVTNKQSCDVDMQFSDSVNIWVKTIAGLQSDTFKLETHVAPLHIIAMPLTSCDGSTLACVHFIITEAILPLKFKDFTAKYIGDNTLLVSFTLFEVSNVSHINILTSTTGKAPFKQVGLVLPDNMVPEKQYSIKVKINTK